MLPLAILIKLMDVANYCGNIFNCILALKRMKTEFPSLCLRTVRGTHSGTFYQQNCTCSESTKIAHFTGHPSSQLSQTELGLKGLVRKRASTCEFTWLNECGRQQASV